MDTIGFFPILIIAIGLAAGYPRIIIFRFFLGVDANSGLVGRANNCQLGSGLRPWLVFALLAFIGGKMIWESLHNNEGNPARMDITRIRTLMTL